MPIIISHQSCHHTFIVKTVVTPYPNIYRPTLIPMYISLELSLPKLLKSLKEERKKKLQVRISENISQQPENYNRNDNENKCILVERYMAKYIGKEWSDAHALSTSYRTVTVLLYVYVFTFYNINYFSRTIAVNIWIIMGESVEMTAAWRDVRSTVGPDDQSILKWRY